jgi:hypothetical protein
MRKEDRKLGILEKNTRKRYADPIHRVFCIHLILLVSTKKYNCFLTLLFGCCTYKMTVVSMYVCVYILNHLLLASLMCCPVVALLGFPIIRVLGCIISFLMALAFVIILYIRMCE